MLLKKHILLKFMSFWPPFWGAGVKVKRVSADFREIDVQLGLHFWNQNYVGTQFGGSLYAMTDPFYMLMLIENLGPDYIVWDKAAHIHFKKPGRGLVHCHFRLTEEIIKDLLAQLKVAEKIEPTFLVQIFDTENNLIAEVEKLLYIRKKSSIKK